MAAKKSTSTRATNPTRIVATGPGSPILHITRAEDLAEKSRRVVALGEAYLEYALGQVLAAGGGLHAALERIEGRLGEAVQGEEKKVILS